MTATYFWDWRHI